MNEEAGAGSHNRTTSADDRKKRYCKPHLLVHGAVRHLTGSASSGSTEGSSGTGIMKPGSARSIKENIVEIGRHPLGFGLYLFDYRPEYRDTWGYGRQFGAMADEVEAIVPDAVSRHPDGYQQVDYARLGIVR